MIYIEKKNKKIFSKVRFVLFFAVFLRCKIKRNKVMTPMVIIFKNGVEVKKEKKVSPLVFQQAREMTIKAVNSPENPTTDFKDVNSDCFTFRKGKDNYMIMFDIL